MALNVTLLLVLDEMVEYFKTNDLLGFSGTTISTVYRGWSVKREKHPVSISSLGVNALLMS